MKKLISIFAAIFICSTAIFAKDSYSGDVQILFGAGFDSTKITKNPANLEFDDNLFDFSIATHHLWGSSNVVKVGFGAIIDAGVGSITKFTEDNENVPNTFFAIRSNLLIGPSVGLYFGNIVELNVTPGLSVMCCDVATFFDENTQIFSATGSALIGLGFDLQAKFFPKSVVNPIVGYRYTVNYGKAWGESSIKLDEENAQYENKTYTADSIICNSHTVYVGIGWTW